MSPVHTILLLLCLWEAIRTLCFIPKSLLWQRATGCAAQREANSRLTHRQETTAVCDGSHRSAAVYDRAGHAERLWNELGGGCSGPECPPFHGEGCSAALLPAWFPFCMSCSRMSITLLSKNLQGLEKAVLLIKLPITTVVPASQRSPDYFLKYSFTVGLQDR